MSFGDVMRDQPVVVTGAVEITLNSVALGVNVPHEIVAGVNAAIGAWLMVLHFSLLKPQKQAACETGYQQAIDDVSSLKPVARKRSGGAGGATSKASSK